MQTVRRSAFNVTAVFKLSSRSVGTSSIITTQEQSTHLKSFKEIPGPSSLPFVGPVRHFLPGGSLYHETESIYNLLFEKYGPIVRLDSMFGSDSIVMIYDAQAAGLVLRNENWMPVRTGFTTLDYYRRKHRKSENSYLGLLTDQNESWKKLRSIVNPIMLQPKTIKQYSGTLEKVAEDMITRMRQKRNEKLMIEGNFGLEMNLWALESISLVALGCRLNCLTRDLPADSPERRLIDVVNDIVTMANDLDTYPGLWRYVSTPKFRKIMKCLDIHVELSTYFIRKGIQQIEKKNNDDEKSVLEKLMDINEEVAITMAMDMMFAGIDTASTTIVGTLYLLALNQDKQDKLREEIKSNQESRPYLKACLKESMRRMPVVPLNGRTSTKEYNLMGYKIPKDTNLGFGHQILSLMEEQYPRPNEYIPERWITDKTDPLYHGNADPMAYSPFGFGARSCIGRRIAELETEVLLSKIIENFKVEWSGPPMKIRSSIVNYKIPPFYFVFKDIK